MDLILTLLVEPISSSKAHPNTGDPLKYCKNMYPFLISGHGLR